MKPRRILATTIASLALALPAFAVTDTWDGGGANDNLSTALNWVDNSAPASDLINTDLIFAGGVRLTPNLSAVFSTNSVTFDPTAGAFTIGGSTLTVGTGGIVNNDLQAQTFGNAVTVGTAASTFSAFNAGLTFTNIVNIGANALALASAGGFSFANISGTGTLNKTGTGTMTWAPTATNQFDFTIGAGTVSTTADGSTDVFNATGSIAVNGTSALILGESLTLDGGTLTRAVGATITIAAGRTLTAQNSGTVAFTGTQSFTGANLTVTGAGSAITSTSNINLNGGATIQVSAGGDIGAANGVNIGNGGAGLHTVTVDGAGSQLSGPGGGTWGAFAGVTNVTFSNGAAGVFGGILQLGNHTSAGSSGTVLVQSGADVTSAQTLVANTAAASTSGSITVTGAGSTWTISGSNFLGVGAASGSTGTLTVASGGVFNSATGNSVINATGTLALNGGTFVANGGLTLIGGQFTRDAAGTFTLPASRAFIVQSGGDAIFTGAYTNSTASFITVTGAGSTLSTTDALALVGGSTTTVASGGSIASGGSGFELSGNSVATVDGAGSSLTAASAFIGGSFSGAGSLTLRNGSTGSATLISVDDTLLVSGTSSLSIQSGATLTGTGLRISPNASGNTGTVTVIGVGSSLTLTGAATTNIGAASNNTATLNAQNGGTFTSGTGAVTLNSTGAINIDGGTVNLLGPLVRNGGAVNFTAGSLSIIDNWNVGAGGLLGTSVTLDAARQMTTTATTTIDAFRTLTLDGGTLRTGTLVNDGCISFNSGTLAITGASGFNIGTGALGANVTLGTGANLQVTNTATVASGASLAVDGGGANFGVLNNSGLVEHVRGALTITGAATNLTGADFFAAKPFSVGGVFTNQSGARLTLQNGTGRINGAGSFTNAGLVTGDGVIAVPATNISSGDIRAESGRTLYFTNTFAANQGDLILQGGTLDFTNAITNNATGFISGHGALNTGGLTNNGVIAFSGGNSDIRGDVVNAAGARIVTSGAGVITTFYDDVIHNGLEIFTGANASTVFFGAQSGAGSFTGTGTVYFIGDLRPGNSPASVIYGGDVAFGGASSLLLEIGGLVAGAHYDRLNVAGTLFENGALDIVLHNGFTPHFGDSFDLFDSGAVVGNFDEVNLPALAGGLEWDASNLQSTGQLRVVPEPGAALLVAVGSALLALRRRRFNQKPETRNSFP